VSTVAPPPRPATPPEQARPRRATSRNGRYLRSEAARREQERARALIAAAQVTGHVDEHGRVWRVRQLPSVEPPGALLPEVRPHRRRLIPLA
jgi:hypothetical protein